MLCILMLSENVRIYLILKEDTDQIVANEKGVLLAFWNKSIDLTFC
jgi:hypothetical protein